MTTIMQERRGQFYKRVLELTLAGGAAFWVTNFAISLTPIAAEYRAGLSISYFPMLLEALVGGVIIGIGVSYFLLRFYDKIPTKTPILKSVILSLIALIIATILLEVPSHFVVPNSDPMRYFLIGLLINVLRILALGIVIGYLYERLYKGRTLPTSDVKSPTVIHSPKQNST
ncbi:MAG TPA: hypothetical protein VFF30_19485 [Nitrososphaerales archaeon]|nr:hypothetical protein [Nitrososphaerales archaeon]